MDKWSPLEEGDAMTFVSSAGIIAIYTLLHRYDFTDSNVSGRSIHGTCRWQYSHAFSLNDSESTLNIKFHQTERGSNKPVDQHSLEMTVEPEEPSGTFLAMGYTFNINVLTSRATDWFGRPSKKMLFRYYPERQIGQTVYQVVIEKKNEDHAFVEQQAPSIASAITRAVFAESIGLVEFERVDGTVFSRVPE